jgi:DNA polymerase III alpha subunit
MNSQFDQIIVDEHDVVEMFLQNTHPHMLTVLDTAPFEIYNQLCDVYGIDRKVTYQQAAQSDADFDYTDSANWFMPDHYKNLSVELELLEKIEQMGYNCDSVQWKRVQQEYAEFESRGMIPLLQYMVYIVDLMREHDIVWGVGRGSSVSSYILFLLGVHKIDSVRFNLDFKEFLR